MSKHKKLISAGTQLTVILRNDAPIRHAEAAPSFRRVTINLTADQEGALRLTETDTIGRTRFYEEVDRMFFEDNEEV